jgi:hypothetical protein
MSTPDYKLEEKTEWTMIFILEFARTFGLSWRHSFRFLSRFGGIAYIDECYGYAHTQSFEDMVNDIAAMCNRMGGKIAKCTEGLEKDSSGREVLLMKLQMVGDLALLLIEKDPSLTMEQAMATVFNSETYEKLMDERTGLYYQSPRYVFSYLTTELETGKLG